MNQDVIIKEVLEDLYRVDPELRTSEAELTRMISKLLAARPDTAFDEKFRDDLRARVLAEFGGRARGRSVAGKTAFRTLFSAPRLIYALGGTVLGALLVTALIYSPGSGGPAPGRGSATLGLDGGMAGLGLGPSAGSGSGPKIAVLGERAFGSLISGQEQSGAPREGGADRMMAAASVAAPAAAEQPAPAPGTALGRGGGGFAPGTVPESLKMSYQVPVAYQFKYSGDIGLTDARVDVLKRVSGLDAQLLAGMIGRLDLNLIDLGRLRDLSVQNISLTEDRDLGYWVNINFEEGSIGLSQNWSRWPQPYACSPGTVCEPNRLRLEDMPSDEELIVIADAFIKEMGVASGDYGPPKVDNSWRRYYETAEEKSEFWFPDQITVEYPLLIDGRKVYNSDGRTVGMMVGVDVRNRKVANLAPIYSQRYASSAYDAVTDASLAEEIISRGGIMPMYTEGAEKTVELELGEPEQAYYSHWVFANGRSENVLVPALVFPIKDKPQDGSIWLEQVVLPLAKEIVDQYGSGWGPMPLMKEAPLLIEPAPAAGAVPVDLAE